MLGDGWVRQLVHHLTDTPGLLTILAVRSANDWQKRFPFSRKRSTCSVFELDYLTEAQAEHFFAAQDIEDENLKSAFKAWAESKPNGYHPVLLGVCTDIMRIQNAKGKDVDPREFRIVPKTEEERFHGLSKKFFQVLDRERSFALITLSACQAIDLSAFLLLSQTFYYEEREELFRAIGNFSFVDEKHNGVQHSLHLHPAIAPYVKKYGNKLVREARQTLLEDFREKAKTGDETAEAEAMFHTNALDWELGIVTFFKIFDQALEERRFGYLRLLLNMSQQLQVHSDYWQARLQQAHGKYLMVAGCPEQAGTYYQLALERITQFCKEHARDADAIVLHSRLCEALADISELANESRLAEQHYLNALHVCEQGVG